MGSRYLNARDADAVCYMQFNGLLGSQMAVIA